MFGPKLSHNYRKLITKTGLTLQANANYLCGMISCQ